ncbi:MAG: glycine--tRNA ligase [Nanoarchaeota archaeon]
MVEKKEKDVGLTIDELTSFCKRKGFVFRSSEIYGGFSGFWDFGPLGVEFYNNIKRDFWKFFVHQRENMVGIEASIISHPRTWKASGHLTSFSDVAVVCKKCKNATKIDKSDIGKVKCNKCGSEYQVQGEFNLLFKTNVGSLNSGEAYLRGETAQGMFMNFKLVQETSRKQLPFGVVQIGRCFRNEIAPRDFLFRAREFDIGELEFFINPDEKKCFLLENEHLNLKLKLLDAETQGSGKEALKETTIGKMLKEKRLDEWHAYWLAEQLFWFAQLGLLEKIKVREHKKSELSHYSSATFDMDFEYPFGSEEVAGNANRGQYDLTQHMKESGQSMELFDEESKKKVIPKVIEPTFGMGRVFLALLCNGYEYDKKRKNIVLKLPSYLAPIKVAVLPIVKDGKMIKLAKEIASELRSEWNVAYDESGSIGRRYSRNDEIGTPMCIAVDDESLKEMTVTIRDRDSTKQVKVKISELKDVVRKVILGEDLLKFGKKVETRVKGKD